jgi:hypothetical protein
MEMTYKHKKRINRYVQFERPEALSGVYIQARETGIRNT